MTEFKMPTDGVVVCLEDRVEGLHVCNWSVDAYLHLSPLFLYPFSWFCTLFAAINRYSVPCLGDTFYSDHCLLVLQRNYTDSKYTNEHI